MDGGLIFFWEIFLCEDNKDYGRGAFYIQRLTSSSACAY